MNERIIYETEDGFLAVITPAPNFVAIHGVEEVARKDVPAGVPYKIVDVSDFPEDAGEFRAAWTADFSTSDGVGIGADAWFAEQAAKE